MGGTFGTVAGVVEVRGFGAGPEFAQRMPRLVNESAIATLVCGFCVAGDRDPHHSTSKNLHRMCSIEWVFPPPRFYVSDLELGVV